MWTLEVLDNRAGGGLTNNLVSWQMEFTFANTNFLPPPVLADLSTNVYSVIESNLFTLTNTATYSVSSATLIYTLSGPPGASINNNGVITWTPAEDQAPSSYIFVTTVYDAANPTKIARNSFQVDALESNLPPVITFPTTNTVLRILETIPFLTNAVATDPDIPANPLTFALVGSTNVSGAAATGLAVLADGTIFWQPTETNGPSTNIIFISVTDTNPPAVNQKTFTVTNTFTIVVLESNLPPVLFLPPNTNISEQIPWSALATATDPDFPANSLTFKLVSGPLGLTVSPAGAINWTPDESQGPGDYNIFVSVTDTNPWAVNQKSFSVTNSFTIHVDEVNTAPFWTNAFPNVAMDELTTLTITNLAVDRDIPTNILTYTLTNSPAWASINPASGVITLSPLETNGPSTNVLTVVVTDNGAPPLSALTNFTVVVNEVNLAPFWPNTTPTNYFIVATNTFVLTNTAGDLDIPTNSLTYLLLTNPPGATIDTNTGVITFPTTLADTGSNYVFTTVVTDFNPYALFNQSLSATNTFILTVVATNTAPYWPTNISNVTMDELTTTNILVTALDNDVPQNNLTYSLLNAPMGMTITTVGTNGLITWTPSEAQGFGVFSNILVVVCDNVLPTPLYATNAPFSVTVLETNVAPQFRLASTNFTVALGVTLVITNDATDADLPANTLTYSLLNPPAGASVNSASGVLTLNLNLGTNLVTTVVTDNGIPPLSATNVFTVIVTNAIVTPTNFVISDIIYTNIGGTNGFLLTWFAPTNVFFKVQWSSLLAPQTWGTFTNPPQVGFNLFIAPTNSRFQFFDNGTETGGFGPTRFYRLLLLTNAPNTAPVFPPQSARYVTPGSTLLITNPATDAQAPPQTLTYTLISPPSGATINPASGLITWTPGLALAGTTNFIKAVATDDGSPNLSGTNTISVIVFPIPVLGSAISVPGGTQLQWSGFTNEQFQVRWATNLVPPISWTLFPQIITSTTGTFTFTDTNAPLWLKFYQLILLP